MSDVHAPRIPRTHTFGSVWGLYFHLNRKAREGKIWLCTALLVKQIYFTTKENVSAILKVGDIVQKIIHLKSELNCECSGSCSFPTRMVTHCPSVLSSAFWYYLLKSQRTCSVWAWAHILHLIYLVRFYYFSKCCSMKVITLPLQSQKDRENHNLWPL